MNLCCWPLMVGWICSEIPSNGPRRRPGGVGICAVVGWNVVSIWKSHTIISFREWIWPNSALEKHPSFPELNQLHVPLPVSQLIEESLCHEAVYNGETPLKYLLYKIMIKKTHAGVCFIKIEVTPFPSTIMPLIP